MENHHFSWVNPRTKWQYVKLPEGISKLIARWLPNIQGPLCKDRTQSFQISYTLPRNPGLVMDLFIFWAQLFAVVLKIRGWDYITIYHLNYQVNHHQDIIIAYFTSFPLNPTGSNFRPSFYLLNLI